MVKAKEESGVKTVFIDPRKIEIVIGSYGKKEARFNPRTLSNPGFGSEEMDRLRKAISKDGLNHALLVRIDDETGQYKLVAGERRLRTIQGILDADKQALEKIQAGEQVNRVLVKNHRNGKMEPALDVYGTIGVECKITDVNNERDFIRLAIQENTLHEPLTDFEVLLQCRNMENAGFSRSEQAEILEMSEAWISQSHSLLNGNANVLKAMENNQVTRTAALLFLKVNPEKVDLVLRQALNFTYQDAENKEAQAKSELVQAEGQIQVAETALTLSTFTGNTESAKKAKRQLQSASKQKSRAEESLEKAKVKKKKKITEDVITKAAQEIEGASDDLNKPMSMKNVRVINGEIKDMLKVCKDEIIIRPDTKQKFSRRDIRLVYNILECVINQNHCKHPLDAILLAERELEEEYTDE